MKYIEILEKSVPTKSSVLNKASSNRTLGFEVEFYIYNMDEYDDEDIPSIEDRIEQLLNNESIEEYFEHIYINDVESSFSEDFDEIASYEHPTKREYIENFKNNNSDEYQLNKSLYERFDNLDWDSLEERKNLLIDVAMYLQITDPNERTDEAREDIINKVNNLDEERIDHNLEKAKEILSRLNPDALSEEDLDEKMERYVKTKDDSNEILLISSVTYNDIKRIVDDPGDVYSQIENRFKEHISDQAEHDFETEREENEGAISGYSVASKIRDNINEHVEFSKTVKTKPSGNTWIVTTDESVVGGFELKSPVFENIDEGIQKLSMILDMIDNDPDFKTESNTGLHINIGNIDVNNIDFLKFMVFIGEENILEEFNRKENNFTKPILSILYNKLMFNNISGNNYDEILETMKETILTYAKEKFRFVSLRNLFTNNYIEIRGIGGEDYEKKKDTIIKFVRKIAHRLDIAEDPNMYKKEYLKKIYDVIKDKLGSSEDVTSIRPLTKKQTISLMNYLESLPGIKNLVELDNTTSDVAAYNQIQKMTNDINAFIHTIKMIGESTKNIPEDIKKILQNVYKYVKSKNGTSGVNLKRLKDLYTIVNREGVYDDTGESRGHKDVKEFLENNILPDIDYDLENI